MEQPKAQSDANLKSDGSNASRAKRGGASEGLPTGSRDKSMSSSMRSVLVRTSEFGQVARGLSLRDAIVLLETLHVLTLSQ